MADKKSNSMFILVYRNIHRCRNPLCSNQESRSHHLLSTAPAAALLPVTKSSPETEQHQTSSFCFSIYTQFRYVMMSHSRLARPVFKHLCQYK